jgi:hypothetical protein
MMMKMRVMSEIHDLPEQEQPVKIDQRLWLDYMLMI